jgi:2'-5' RNA ligase
MKEFFCLWLVPELETEAELAELLVELSADLGGPLFSPHLTLIGETEDERDALDMKLSDVAARFPAFEAPVVRVETGDSYYQSLYLRFENAGTLRALKEALVAVTVPENVDAFMPHVSLFYGESAGKADAAARLQDAWAGRNIRFDRLVIVPSGRRVPIDEWTTLGSFQLG